MISDMLENKNDIFTSENLEILNYKNPMINTKSFANLLPPPLMNMNINMNTFNKSQIFPFSMNYPGIRPVEKINENIDDFRYMNQKNLTTPFKRAGTHVAIAYYIYVNKNKSKFNDNKNTNECDPTYHARVLREKKNVIFFFSIIIKKKID